MNGNKNWEVAIHIYSKSSSIAQVATIADNICKDNTTDMQTILHQ